MDRARHHSPKFAPSSGDSVSIKPTALTKPSEPEPLTRDPLGTQPAPDHLCLVRIGRRYWRWLRGSALALIGIASTWAALIQPSVSPLRADVRTLGAACGVTAWLGTSIVTTCTLVAHFTPDQPSAGDWKRRRVYLGISLSVGATAAACSLMVVIRPASLLSAWMAMLVVAILIYAIADREAHFHSQLPAEDSQVLAKTATGTLVTSVAIVVTITGLLLVHAPLDLDTLPSNTVVTTKPLTPPSTPTTVAGGSGLGQPGAPAPPNEPTQGDGGPCPYGPGAGVPDIVTSSKMTKAAPPATGARKDWGCIGPPKPNGDNSFLQQFDSSSSFLLGSHIGAGIVGDIYADVLRTLTDGNLSVTGLGGQPLDLIDCAGKLGDFLAIVGAHGQIIRLFGRARKARLLGGGHTHYFEPYEIPSAFFAPLLGAIEDGRVPLAPDGPAQLTAGTETQVFVDPSTDLTHTFQLQAPQTQQLPAEFTTEVLYQACTGTHAPSYMVVP